MIIFDFDGVLIDSINEIALSAYNLVTGYRLTSPTQLPSDFRKLFLANRHLTLAPLRTVSLTRWVLKTLESGNKTDIVLDREDFLENIVDHNDTESRSEFYAIRQWLIDEHLNSWLEANPPFQTVWNACKELDPKSFFILTYKNRAAVHMLCKHYGLKFNEAHLFTGERGRTKRENILELDKISPKDTNYIFVDDAVENLEALSPVLPGRIHSVLATWGYASQKDLATAQNHGHELASEAEFVKRYLSE